MAERVLREFNWGPTFFKINEDVLGLYEKCEGGSEGVKEVEGRWRRG